MNLLELYCHVDDFVKTFLPEWNKHLIASNKKRRRRTSRLSVSEIITHPKRIYSHKVFKGIAEIGKTTKGWFYGFKLHLICNHPGDLISCKITPGNVDDRHPVPEMTEALFGKLFGDKGYISKTLFEELFTSRGLQLVTGIKGNMKNKLMPLFDKLILRKRSMIESINNQLKNVFQVEHTRHRSVINGFVNIIAAIVAFVHHDKKPRLNLDSLNIRLMESFA